MKQQDHLSKDEVIRAIVDESGLSQNLRDHLAGCDSCRNECSRLKGELNSFAAMSSTLVPPMRKTVMLPACEPERRVRSAGFRLALGSALAAVVVAVVAAGVYIHGIPGQEPNKANELAALQQEAASDELLMNEVARLVDNPMPQAWADMGSTPDLDMDAMDAIVPGGDDDYWLL
jgi:predicted anti-sigma-YlaC factor YlaD